MKRFGRDGIQFQYPANWQLDLDDAEDGWTVTVQSPATAFVIISLRKDANTAAQVAEETLSVFRSEYSTLDAEPALDSIAGLPALGFNLDFVTLDATITCRIRCVDTSAGPLLVLTQTSEYDREPHEPILEAIGASIQLDD